MAQNKYTPANRKLAGWLGDMAEKDGKIIKTAFQTIPTVILYETEAKSAAFDKMLEEFQAEEDAKAAESGDAPDMKDIEKRIEEAKTPEELAALEKELNSMGDAAEEKPEEKADDKPEADKPEAEQTESTAPASTPPASAPAPDAGLAKEIEDLKKEIEGLKSEQTLEQQVKTLQKQVDNIQPIDNVDMNDSLNQSASKIAYIKRQIRRLKAGVEFKEGDKVKVPNNGKMVDGKIVRRDKGDKHGSPFYIVDIGEYASIKVPEHEVRKASNKSADLNSNQIEQVVNVVNSDDTRTYQEIAQTLSGKIGAREEDIYSFLFNNDTNFGIRRNIDQKRY